MIKFITENLANIIISAVFNMFSRFGHCKNNKRQEKGILQLRLLRMPSISNLPQRLINKTNINI